jgi:hypothetical protein
MSSARLAKILSALSTALIACYASHPTPLVSTPRSYAEHLAAAEAHDTMARELQRRAEEGLPRAIDNPYICDEVTRLDELTNPSGFFLGTLVDKPCWNIFQQAWIRDRITAHRERTLAQRERTAAARMAHHVSNACGPLSANQRQQSPFEPRDRIAQIIPVGEGSAFRGVRVVFRPIPGLYATQVATQIACRHAEWVSSGQDPTFAPNDPTLMPGQSVQVYDHIDHVEVLIVGRNPVDTEIAYNRLRYPMDVNVAAR